MEHPHNEKYVIALEIGSSHAKIGVAGFTPDDPRHTLTIYNAKTLPTVDSVRYGRITNIREVAETVTNLIDSIEKQAPIQDRNILGVYVSIGGRTLKSIKTSARTVLPERREITEDIVERVRTEAIEALSTPLELMCIEPTRFTVDNTPSPRPVGTLGTRLAAEFTAVVCNSANKTDIIDVVADRVGISVCGVSVRPIALAHLVLSPQETNAGCMLVDFGAETTTVAIYKNYSLQYLATIPLGSRLITLDLAALLALTEENAENVKTTIAGAIPGENSAAGVDDRLIKEIDSIVSARLADIVANIDAQPGFAGYRKDELPAGIILAGGGARLRNFGRLLDNATGMKVRVATLPPDIIITDANFSATDNLDLIALLNEAAEETRLNPEIDCVTAAAPQADEPEEPEYGTENNVVYDILTGTYATENLDPVQKEKLDQSLAQRGYDPAEFDNTMTETEGEDGLLMDDDPDDDLDDRLGLADDDDVDRERQRRAQLKLREEQRRKRQYEARIKAEQSAKRKEERQKRRQEVEDSRQYNPSRLDKIINRITGLLSGNNEDQSADLDD